MTVVLLVTLSLATVPVFAQEVDEKDVPKLMAEAQKKLNEDKPSEARENLEKVVKSFPNNGMAQLLLGDVYGAMQEWVSAGSAYRKAVANLTGPDQAKANAGLSEAMTKQAKYESAVEAGQKALDADPTSLKAMTSMAFSLAKTGKLQEAADMARQALGVNANSPVANATLGEALLADKKYDEAEAAFKKALQIDPENAESHAGMADIYLRQEKYDDAIAASTKALELNDKLTRAYALRGMANNAKGEPGAAYSDLSMAVTVNPDDPDAQFAFAQVYQAQGNMGMAGAAYQRALNINPAMIEAYEPLAKILMDRGSYTEATEILKQGTERLPDSALLQYYLGLCMYYQTQPDAALAAFRKASELDPDLVGAIAGEGTVLLDKQDVAGAIPLLQKATDLEPDNAKYLTDYGRALATNKQFADAIPPLMKAADSPDYNDHVGFYYLGFAQLNEGNTEAAVEAFNRAIEAYPDWGDPHRMLGWALYGTIKPGCPCGSEDEELVAKIVAAYEKAVELGVAAPDLKERVEALQKGEKVK
jgi:superkiller protein 3